MQEGIEGDLEAISQIDAIPKILEVICRTTGLGFSAVARVTESQWIACAVRDDIGLGLQPGGELKLETTLCNTIRSTRTPLIIDDVAADPNFRDHPTPQMYGFQSYISVPITRKDGRVFGTLCALDPRPALLTTSGARELFTLFAELIALHLDARDRLVASATELLEEHQIADLREQFIAVLGHDLRNPLAAIDASNDVLLTLPLSDKAVQIGLRIRRSTARMIGLVDNLMDFAKSRLGGGLSLKKMMDVHLEQGLDHVVAELQLLWPERAIRSEFLLATPTTCDSARVGQMLSNLLANALAHGDPASEVVVRARSDATGFKLSVTNRGAPIPLETIKRLFQPFSRDSMQSGRQGLGLGLYIASEIARAHDGTLVVVSAGDETRFTFWIPPVAGTVLPLDQAT